eukprot:TRINITY_DN46393_c0_g1_i1.p1 TRINITY_DN46393_c0_g1~~TRINITY_DN46393_c0_g1_i1.p1  ORF type:complete len:332 (-),score=51.10 TRINITY_DN46393_c0_g1_i1:216-1184(-)
MQKDPPKIREVVGRTGLVFSAYENIQPISCKPKILPLQSLTAEQWQAMEEKALQYFNRSGWQIDPQTNSELPTTQQCTPLPVHRQADDIQEDKQLAAQMEDLRKQITALQRKDVATTHTSNNNIPTNSARCGDGSSGNKRASPDTPSPPTSMTTTTDDEDEDEDMMSTLPHPFCPLCLSALRPVECDATSSLGAEKTCGLNLCSSLPGDDEDDDEGDSSTGSGSTTTYTTCQNQTCETKSTWTPRKRTWAEKQFGINEEIDDDHDDNNHENGDPHNSKQTTTWHCCTQNADEFQLCDSCFMLACQIQPLALQQMYEGAATLP